MSFVHFWNKDKIFIELKKAKPVLKLRRSSIEKKLSRKQISI